MQQFITSVSRRSPNWRTDSSIFVLKTIPSEDSDLLLKNEILWLLEDVFGGLRNDSCDPLDDQSDPFVLASSSPCHQDSSTLSPAPLMLGASILFSLRRLSSVETDDCATFCPVNELFSSCSSAFSIQEL